MDPLRLFFQLLFSFLIETTIIIAANSDYYLFVESNKEIKQTNMKRFWRSTGFCPSKPHSESFKYDNSPDMAQNLAFIGAIPFSGIQQVRIHWLLDLVQIQEWKSKPSYNFLRLDQLVDHLYANELFPGFELMGTLNHHFNDFNNKTQIYLWKDLVKTVAERYIKKYGLRYVQQWNFETWNEPDCHDFDAINMTVEGFLNYYDACSEGLKAADKSLKFGGPGDGCYYKKNHHGHKKFANALLNHVINGTNYFTKEKGVRIDFLSWHLKGNGKAKHIIDLEQQLGTEILSKYPTLKSKPFYNDEADPLVGWSKPRVWRADVSYAALVVKIINQHLNSQESLLLNYSLLSNDNAFLSYFPHQFTQRTLLARFQMNNTNPSHVQFICKPVYTAMVMLAYLAEQQLLINITKNGFVKYENENFGGLATRHIPNKLVPSDSFQISLLLFNASDPGPSEELDISHHPSLTNKHKLNIHIYVNVPLESSKDLQMVVYKINNTFGNPYAAWKKMGKPNFPSKLSFQEIRKHEGLQRLQHVSVNPGVVVLPVSDFSAPSLLLIHICSKALSPPGLVILARVSKITKDQVLVVWSDTLVISKCILTYEVEFSRSGFPSDFKRINEFNTTLTAFVFSPIETPSSAIQSLTGYYRVRAVDYWHRPGVFSVPFFYSESN